MVFPELKIINDKWYVDSTYDKFYLCELDWSMLDSWKINGFVNNIRGRITKPLSEVESVAFDTLIKDNDWQNWLYPTELEPLYKNFQQFVVPQSYYKEIEHYKNLALSERDRKTGLDTNVRDRVFEVSETAVKIYFYLIYDAIYMWNTKLFTDQFFKQGDLELMQSLWLYRFWKHQTGSGLVINKSLRCYQINNQVHQKAISFLEPIFKENNQSGRFELSNLSFEEDILKEIKTLARNMQIEQII